MKHYKYPELKKKVDTKMWIKKENNLTKKNYLLNNNSSGKHLWASGIHSKRDKLYVIFNQ